MFPYPSGEGRAKMHWEGLSTQSPLTLCILSSQMALYLLPFTVYISFFNQGLELCLSTDINVPLHFRYSV